MAKCDLSIELDEPDVVHPGGGKVTGKVRVHLDADVNCKGLEVSSTWRTHGRGNIASGTAGSITLFAGQWKAGDEIEYPFELPIADWPPSYHGHYLNIDHYVDARAKIPWAFDPKASAPFMMRPTCGSDSATVPKNVTEVKGVLGCILGVVFFAMMCGFVVMLAQLGWFALVFALFPLAGFVFWFIKVFLPKYLLGDVQYEFKSDTVSPGQSASGELVIRPRKNVAINGVLMNFEAREQCVSGSGSNRTTHKYVFFEQVETLQDAVTLTAGNEHRFALQVSLPDEAPYSVDLDDNEIIWSATLRVDIPRWPDWVQEIPLLVVPADGAAKADAGHSGAVSAPVGHQTEAETRSPETVGDGITFRETANHLWSVRGDREQVEMLVEAVNGLSFEIEATVERRVLYAGDEDPHVYKDGYAVWASYPDPELPLVLYVPHELAEEFEQAGRGVWRGRGTIVGWDSLHGRLQIKIDRPL